MVSCKALTIAVMDWNVLSLQRLSTRATLHHRISLILSVVYLLALA